MARRMESEGGCPSPPCLRRYGNGTTCPCPKAASTFLCCLLASFLPVSLFLSSLPPTWPSLLWPRGPLRQLHACPTIAVPQGFGTCFPPCPKSCGSFPRLPHTLGASAALLSEACPWQARSPPLCSHRLLLLCSLPSGTLIPFQLSA